jgi:hypothetical protein
MDGIIRVWRSPDGQAIRYQCDPEPETLERTCGGLVIVQPGREMIMPNEPEATAPAMDVERRAEQLYAESVRRSRIDRSLFTDPAAVLWLNLNTTDKDHYRLLAHNDLAEEAKRRGDHDTLREMHGTLQTVTGAAGPVFAAVTPGIEVAYGQLTEATRELTEAVRVLVLAVQDLDDTVEDDGKIDAAQDAAEVVANLLGIGGN